MPSLYGSGIFETLLPYEWLGPMQRLLADPSDTY
jgi:hypothetical protein